MTAKPGRRRPVMSLTGDPRHQFRALQQVHDAVLSGSRAPAPSRPLIAESWRRSLDAHVDPDAYRPPEVYASDEVADVRAAHPLHSVVPLLRKMLVDIADAARHIMIVTDAHGTILWREGALDVCQQADPVGLCEGTRWAEDTIGTNAMGTALAVDAPVQIYSAEHLVRTYHTWSCAAAPVHDPDTGRQIGVIDVSGYLQSFHPAVITLVTATAELAESQLRVQMARRDERLRTKNLAHLAGLRGEAGALLTSTGRVVAAEPGGTWPERIDVQAGTDTIALGDGREARLEPLPEGYLLRVPRAQRRGARRPALSLSFLRDRPGGVLDGRELLLTLRRAELLALLALHPAGLTAEQLALQLYGEYGNPTTARAEVHRLRAQLGEEVIRTKPYRLRAEVDADFLAARMALRARDAWAALAVAQAPLLARSEAPAIRAERDELEAALRRAVLDRRDTEAIWEYSQREPGRDDIEVFERLAADLPRQDPRHPIAAARLSALRTEDS
ncbi:MAG: GAF domain-containing protein [Streptosporangiaceae bacterium]